MRRRTHGELGRILIGDAGKRLVEAYPAQVRAALETLSEDELWARPNASSNSVGNLVLDLAGSTHHFLGRGVGGTGYARERPAESRRHSTRSGLARCADARGKETPCHEP